MLVKMQKFFIFFVIATSFLLLLTCDALNPGLGPAVDINAPQVDITSHVNGEYVYGTVTLSGTLYDDTSIVSTDVTRDANTYPTNHNNSSWTVDIDTTVFNDGAQNFTVTAIDSEGKKTAVDLLLIIDNTPPTVVVTTPSITELPNLNRNVTIKGEATDTTRVLHVLISLYKASDDTVIFEDQKAVGTSSWYYTFDSSSIGIDSDGEDVYINVIAEDNSGNRNSFFYHFDDLLQETVDNGHNPDETPNVEEIHEFWYENDKVDPSFELTEAELTAIQLTTFPSEQMGININQNTDNPQIYFISPGDSFDSGDSLYHPEDNKQPRARFDGEIRDDDGVERDTIRLIVWNKATNDPDADYITDLAPITIGNEYLTLSGVGNSKVIQWSFDESNDFTLPPFNLGSSSFPESFTEGDYWIEARADDISNPAIPSREDADPRDSNVVTTFDITTEAPLIQITSPNQGFYVGDGMGIHITVDLDNTDSNDGVWIDPDGIDNSDDEILMVKTAGGSLWEAAAVTITAGSDFTVADGAGSLIIRAGTPPVFTGPVITTPGVEESHITLQYTGDIEDPETTVDIPPSGARINGANYKISGSATDNNVVKAVYLYLQKNSDQLIPELPATPPAPDPAPAMPGVPDVNLRLDPAEWAAEGWIKIDGANVYNWNKVVDTTSLTDNRYYNIYVRAVDAALKLNVEPFTQIIIDQSTDNPVFSFSNLNSEASDASGNMFGSGAVIYSTVTDDDDVDASTLQIEFNNSGTWNDVFGVDPGDSTRIDWEYSLSSLPQGEHSLKVKVSDTNGTPIETVTTAIPFTIDTGPPVISLNPVSSTQKETFTISGTAIDAINVNDVRLYVDSVEQTVVFTPVTFPATPETSVNWSYEFIVDDIGPFSDVGPFNDGLYLVEVQADDTTSGPGKTSSDSWFFTVDTIVGSAVITSVPATPANDGASFTFEGTAADAGSGVNAVRVAFISDGTGAQLAAGTTNWAATVDLVSAFGSGPGAEGSKTLYVQVEDRAGNLSAWTDTQQLFVYDTALPVTTLTGDANRYENSGFSIGGNASDNYGIASVAISQSKDGGADVPVITDGPTGTTTWTLDNLPRDPADIGTPLVSDAMYVYKITSTDRAGKTSTETVVTVEVDHTVPETLSITAPGAGQTGLNALFGDSYIFRGTALDAGVGIDRIYYLIDQDLMASITLGDYTAFSTTGSWNFIDDFTVRNEGRWYIHVLAEDKAGNRTAYTSAETVMFDIDQSAPTLSETDSGISGSSVVYRNADISFGGGASDGGGMASVTLEYSKDGAAAVQILNDTTDDGTWAVILYLDAGPDNIPLTGDDAFIGDGSFEFTITATDNAGKTSIITRNIIVDTAEPDLTIESPSVAESVDNSSYTIHGKVTDNSGKGVELVEYSMDGSTYTSISYSSGLNWSLAGVDFSNPTGEGAKTLYVRAWDGLNLKAVESVNFSFDLSPPTLTETTAPSETNDDFALSGTFSDTNAVNTLVITATKDSTDQGIVFSTAAANWVYPKTLPNDGTDDGVWEYTLTATDIAGRTTVLFRTVVIDETAPETLSFQDPGSYISGNIASLLGSSGDTGSGLAALGAGGVEYSMDNATWLAVSGAPTNWNIPVDLDIDGAGADTGLAEGSHTIWVRALDNAGNRTAALSQVFIVDQSAPFLSNLKEEAGADWGDVILYKALDFAISGMANDTNGIADVTITQSKDGGAAADLTVTLNGSAGDTTRTWSVNTDIAAGQGNYAYNITLIDDVGRQYSILKTVIVDTSNPDAPTVTAPIVNQWLSGTSFVATGTSADNGTAGIADVFYQTDVRGATPPADLSDASWLSTVGTTSWNGTFSLTGEGERSLFVVARDQAGNQSPLTTLDFGIDQNNPILSISDGTDTIYKNSSFVLSGSASDTNEISSITVEEKFDTGSYGVPIAAGWDSGAGTWSYTRTVTGADSDGNYSFRITAIDAAGRTFSQEKPVNLDRSAPVISFDNPVPYINDFPADPGRVYGNGTMSITGNITEDNGVSNLSTLEYSLDGGGLWTAMTLGSAFTINSVDTTATSDGSDLTISVRASDRNSNVSSDDYIIRIHQDSDKPVVEITAPLEAETISSQTINVAGTISDDDGVSLVSDSVQYRFSSDGGSTWGSWTNVSTSGSSTDRSFSFSFTSSTDGLKTIEMRGEDTNAVPVLSDADSVNFTQDTGAPTLSGLTPVNFSYQNTDFDVDGMATDANGVNDVEIRVLRDGTEIKPFTSMTSLSGSVGDNSRTFTENVDTSSGDGLYQIILRSSDSGFNTREDSIQVYVDKTDPGMSFTSPSSGSTQNNLISITGSTGDNYSVQTLEFRIVDVNAGNTERVLPTGSLSGLSNWTLSNFDTRNATLLSYADDLGAGEYELTLRALVTDKAGNQYSTIGGNDLVFYIDQSSDKPVISMDDIALDGSSSITSSVITGTVSDDDGVNTILVDTYAVDDTVTTETVNLISGSYGDKNIDWSVNLTSSENGLRGIRVRTIDSVDNNGADYTAGDYSRRDSGEIDFVLDTQIPDLTINDPLSNVIWSLNDSFDFSGTSADESGIVSLEYKFDDSDLSNGTTVVAAPFDNWSFTVIQGNLSNGAHTVYIQATDGIGKTRVASRSLIIDKSAPTISTTFPANGDAVFGPLTVSGTTSDNPGGAGVKSVTIGLGNQIDPTNSTTLEASTWNPTGGTVSWSYSFLNINDYANASYSVNTGDTDQDGIEDGGETWTDLWDFSFYVRAEDSAGASGNGNISYLTSYVLQIDPKRDRPEVTIMSPSDGSTVGGFVRVFGSSFDSQFVEKIQIAIDADNDGDYTNDTWAEGTLDVTDAGVKWYEANGTSSWNININEAGEFDPTVGSTRTIAFKVRAKDYKVTPGDGIYGAEEETNITFNKDFPQFVSMNLVSGETVSGTYTLTGLVRDETDIDRIIFSNEGPLLDNTVIFDNPGGLTPPGAANTTGLETAEATGKGMTVELLGTSDPEYDSDFPGAYRVSIPIDTEAAGLYPAGAGSMSVKLTAEDSTTPSPFTNRNLISFSVDNIDPSSLIYNGDSEILGTNAELKGTVRDLGTVAGINRVVLYLENRDNELVQLKGGSGTIASFNIEDVYDPDNPTYNDYRIVIDNSLEGGVPGDDLLPSGDGDGYDERLAFSAGVYQWSALFDSTLVSDGAVTAHYRAVDYAGNQDEDNLSAFIANNKPSIISLILGTDLDDSGTVEAGEQSTIISTGYASSGFSARNERLYIGVNTIGGNGTKRYSVKYGAVEQNGTLTDNTIVINTSGYAESSAADDQTLTIKVYDSTTSDNINEIDELSDTITLGLTIDNIDTTPPTLSVVELGEQYSESADDSAKTLGPVSDYEDNIAMNAGSRLGHVEYGTDSQYNGADSDVSGRVIFKGKVEDNQRIQTITATIPGYNGDAPFNVYTAAGGPLSGGADWSFAFDGSDYLTEANGNVFNWNFTFNTAIISTITVDNLGVTLTAYDFNPTANGGLGNLGSFARSVDVVPYISEIERNPLSYNTDRSKRGVYPVQVDEAGILIKGFNLSDSTIQDVNNWIRVYNTGLIDFQSPLITAAAANRDELTISLTGINRSGYIRVRTGGITDINMINLNTQDYNKEDDGSGIAGTLWNDDRYLSIWETGDYFAQSNSPEHPSMDIRTSNGRIYGAWSNYASSAAYYSRPLSQAAGISTLFTTYDPPEWTDIAVESGADTVHSVILENYYGGTNTTDWGFLSTRIDTGNRVAIDDMGDDKVGNTNHADGYDEQLYQFQNPRIVISNEGTNQRYVAYYDTWAKAVKYSVATGGAATFTTTNTHQTDSATVVDGLDDFDTNPSDSGDDVGQYLDIQMDPDDNVPVIVYYDTTNKTLKIARGQNSQPNGSAQWNIINVLPVNSFSGQYVTMKTGSNGDLFIAYYKVSTGDLMFIHASDVDGTGSGVQYSFDDPVIVDSEGAVGPWADIFLVDGTPVISYINATQAGTFSGLKLARYTGDESSWEDDTDWESEIIPAESAVYNKRTNIVGLDTGDVTGDNWNVAIGYASSRFDLVYRQLEQ